jgi:hypothetical protein
LTRPFYLEPRISKEELARRRHSKEKTYSTAEVLKRLGITGDASMPQILLDANLSAQLHNVTGCVELCDPTGRVIGRFVPLIDMSQWEPASPAVSDEELQRRAQSTEWYSTEEVLEHLKSLERK